MERNRLGDPILLPTNNGPSVRKEVTRTSSKSKEDKRGWVTCGHDVGVVEDKDTFRRGVSQ